MAKATKLSQPAADVPYVSLTLTRAETDTICAILYRIGGSPAGGVGGSSPREHCDSIRTALEQAGCLTPLGANVGDDKLKIGDRLCPRLSRGMFFEDYTS